MPWNPQKYDQFQVERSQPFHDLAALVTPRPSLRVIDLGCGTGELTATLLTTLPGCTILGIDTSAEMLANATPRQTDRLRFEQADQAAISGEWDVVISNAALQWTDNHPALFAHIWQHIAPGGQLAVQMPSNHDSPAHQAIRTVAAMQPYANQFAGWQRQSPVLPMEAYAHILHKLGARQMDIHERIYPHILDDAGAVLDWISGTALLPYLERIGSHRDAFLAEIRAQLEIEFPGSPVLYPFKRIFISARKPA